MRNLGTARIFLREICQSALVQSFLVYMEYTEVESSGYMKKGSDDGVGSEPTEPQQFKHCFWV